MQACCKSTVGDCRCKGNEEGEKERSRARKRNGKYIQNVHCCKDNLFTFTGVRTVSRNAQLRYFTYKNLYVYRISQRYDKLFFLLCTYYKMQFFIQSLVMEVSDLEEKAFCSVFAL